MMPAPYPSAPIVTVYTPSGAAYMKVTPSADALQLIARPRTVTESLIYAPLVTHKIADANGIAATNPAVTEANSYALANELKGDYNVHIASLVYHVAADLGEVTVANATTEATLVALANSLRTLFGTHAIATSSHGGQSDDVFAAAVTATTAATDAATAITLENALATAWLAHLAVTDQGAYITAGPVGLPIIWPCLGALFVKTSGPGVFTVAEFKRILMRRTTATSRLSLTRPARAGESYREASHV